MRATIRTTFNAPAENVWKRMKKKETFLYITRYFLGFTKCLLGALKFRNICHHSHSAARPHTATAYPIDAAVRSVVLKEFVRWITQTLHSLGNQSVDIAITIVPVLCKVSKELRIWTSGLQELLGYWVHLGETIITKNDV